MCCHLQADEASIVRSLTSTQRRFLSIYILDGYFDKSTIMGPQDLKLKSNCNWANINKLPENWLIILSHQLSIAVPQLRLGDRQVLDVDDEKVSTLIGCDVDGDAAFEVVAVEVRMEVEVVVDGASVRRDPVVRLPSGASLRHAVFQVRIFFTTGPCRRKWTKNFKTSQNGFASIQKIFLFSNEKEICDTSLKWF